MGSLRSTISPVSSCVFTLVLFKSTTLSLEPSSRNMFKLIPLGQRPWLNTFLNTPIYLGMKSLLLLLGLLGIDKLFNNPTQKLYLGLFICTVVSLWENFLPSSTPASCRPQISVCHAPYAYPAGPITCTSQKYKDEKTSFLSSRGSHLIRMTC